MKKLCIHNIQAVKDAAQNGGVSRTLIVLSFLLVFIVYNIFFSLFCLQWAFFIFPLSSFNVYRKLASFLWIFLELNTKNLLGIKLFDILKCFHFQFFFRLCASIHQWRILLVLVVQSLMLISTIQILQRPSWTHPTTYLLPQVQVRQWTKDKVIVNFLN